MTLFPPTTRDPVFWGLVAIGGLGVAAYLGLLALGVGYLPAAVIAVPTVIVQWYLYTTVPRITPTSIKTATWLQRNHSESLAGIDAIRDEGCGIIRIRLDESMDLEVMAGVIVDRGYPRSIIEWADEEGTRTLTYRDVWGPVYSQKYTDQFAEGREEQFAETDLVRVETPFTADGSAHERLQLLAEYLTRKYASGPSDRN